MKSILWGFFEETGSIEAYLRYSEQQRLKERRARKGEADGGTAENSGSGRSDGEQPRQ